MCSTVRNTKIHVLMSLKREDVGKVLGIWPGAAGSNVKFSSFCFVFSWIFLTANVNSGSVVPAAELRGSQLEKSRPDKPCHWPGFFSVWLEAQMLWRKKKGAVSQDLVLEPYHQQSGPDGTVPLTKTHIPPKLVSAFSQWRCRNTFLFTSKQINT